MRKLPASMLAVAALGTAPVALSADSACKLTGSWIGYIGGYATWVGTVDGVSNSAGTLTVDYPALDPTVFGLFPAGAKAGILRGVWESTGGRSFAYTTLAVAVDATGQPVWLGKLSGT
jgi:hypothetical protein